MRSWFILAIAGAILLCIGFPPAARADEWNKETVVTFNEPVEIPGQVLPAGTYVFKLADTLADRTVVQIFNKDRDHIYATILAIPDYRLRPTGKTVLHFEERQANAPSAIQAWFYPGDLYGYEFVYPKSRAAELAKNTSQQVLSMPSEMEANTTEPSKSMQEPGVTAMKEAPVTAVKPTGEQVEMAQAVQTSPSESPAPQTAEMAPNDGPKMPSTASPVPLLALLGLLLATAGAACGFRARAFRVD